MVHELLKRRPRSGCLHGPPWSVARAGSMAYPGASAFIALLTIAGLRRSLAVEASKSLMRERMASPMKRDRRHGTRVAVAVMLGFCDWMAVMVGKSPQTDLTK